MTKNQINITLGTAGHIDHGKTSLVKLLTGCDTDRLKIEKERGMTIELGFAPCRINDMEVGIVDVPGHENFIKTMVAGAAGIDAVLLVIAADDSIMPQTREHLDILTLLGIGHGLVALTKTDIVTNERLSIVKDQIKQFLSGTFLDGKPICPISNVTGKGFDNFLEELKNLVTGIKPKPADGIFRLPVEKAFSLSGFGTIVTGIPIAGQAKIGDPVVLLPENKSGKIKSIQVYSTKSDLALCGQCAAINIPQLDYKSIKRGSVVTFPSCFEPSDLFAASLDMLASVKKPLKNASVVKLHTSTAQINAKVYLLEGKQVSPAAKNVFVQFLLDEPIVSGPGDRFIIRQSSPANTIGGGFLIEAIDQKIKYNDLNALVDIAGRAKAVQNIPDFVEYCIKTSSSHVTTIHDVSLRTKKLYSSIENNFLRLAADSTILPVTKDLYIHRDVLTCLKDQIFELCKSFHSQNPQNIGIESQLLQQQIGISNQLFNFLINNCIASNLLITKNNFISLISHKPALDGQLQSILNSIEIQFKQKLFSPPSLSQIEQIIRIDSKTFGQSIKLLKEQKIILEIEPSMFFHIDAIEKAKAILTQYFKSCDQLESVKFKYLLDTTRKFALPLLDYMDRIGFTCRIGNTRLLK